MTTTEQSAVASGPLARRGLAPKGPLGADPALPRTGIRRRGRLCGSRELCHELLRRRPLRLPAAVGHRRREPDGHADSILDGQAVSRNRSRSGNAVPQRPPASGRVGGLWVQADRQRREPDRTDMQRELEITPTLVPVLTSSLWVPGVASTPQSGSSA